MSDARDERVESRSVTNRCEVDLEHLTDSRGDVSFSLHLDISVTTDRARL